ncbi:MAG TPA: zinc-binding alcohol dehydrogenase, partial [Limnochordia bacterium]|nr:zinc-binding alcohol dehydrogenase [Limnochordia bacterium]
MESQRLVIPQENVCRLERFELPNQPQGSRIRIESIASVISAGTEIANYTGREPRTRIPGSWCAYPWVPGYGNIGRIQAVGPDAPKSLHPGRVVFSFGPHAAHFERDGAPGRDVIVPLPDDIDAKKAVFARMASVAATSLWHCEPYLRVDDTVAVVGLGLVGNLAAQLLQMAGAQVLGFDITPRRREVAQASGIKSVYDPGEALGDAIKAATGGRGARFVIEATGITNLVPGALAGTANNGFCILLGSPRQPLTANGVDHLSDIHLRGLHLMGALEWVYPLHAGRDGRGIDTRLAWLVELIGTGRLAVEPMWTHTLAPSEAPEAYHG